MNNCDKISPKTAFFTQKQCSRAYLFKIYSFFFSIWHIFIHSIIHSIVWWKIFIQRIYSFNKERKLFIQRIYSFKPIPNYSFKENIHSSKKWIIAQGYMCDMSDQTKVQTKVQKGECSFNKGRNQRACRVKIQHLQIFIFPDIQNYQAVWLWGFGSRPKGLGLNTDVLWGLILKYFENVAWLLKNCNFHSSWANENLSLRSKFFLSRWFISLSLRWNRSQLTTCLKLISRKLPC